MIRNSWIHTKLVAAPGIGSQEVLFAWDYKISLLEKDIARVVPDVQQRMNISSFLNQCSEQITNAALIDSDLGGTSTR